MSRTSTFANIGTDYFAPASNGIPKEMDFSVGLKPMGYLDDNGAFNRVKGASTVVDEYGRAYGAVSDNYSPIDNATALGSLQYIDGMNIVKYGATNTGMQYIIGQLPTVNILDDDFTPYLIYRNSFNGRFPIQATICPLRIVCQNQFNIAFSQASNMMNIRHTVRAEGRLEEAQRILMDTADYLQTLKAQAEKWASVKVSKADENRLLAELFPIKDTMTDRQKQTIQDKVTAFQVANAFDDNNNFRGTFWGLLNAYSDAITHEQPKRITTTGEENRFMAVTFDPKIMQRFISVAQGIGIAA